MTIAVFKYLYRVRKRHGGSHGGSEPLFDAGDDRHPLTGLTRAVGARPASVHKKTHGSQCVGSGNTAISSLCETIVASEYFYSHFNGQISSVLRNP
jgi:hypothetical protein